MTQKWTTAWETLKGVYEAQQGLKTASATHVPWLAEGGWGEQNLNLSEYLSAPHSQVQQMGDEDEVQVNEGR